MNKYPLPIREVSDSHQLPSKWRESPLEKLYRVFFGDDVFISYARADATRYVPSLAARLAKDKYICFFDQLAADPNEELPDRLKKKILRSTVFVLVGTKGAVSSPSVHKEIELFRRTRRPFIPIDVDGALTKEKEWRDLIGVAKIHEQGVRIRDGNPSSEVISLIKDSFNYRRRTQWLRASLFVGISLILTTIAVSLFVIRAAAAEAAAIKRLAESEVTAANVKVNAAEQRLLNLSSEADRQRADADAARNVAERARKAAQQAASKQKAAEQSMRRAQELERHSVELAAEMERRENGSREIGMERDALALAIGAAEQSLASRGDFSSEVMDGVTASADVADYSLPLEEVQADAIVFPTISPNGERLVGTIFDPRTTSTRLVIWDGKTGKKLFDVTQAGSIFPASFSRDGNRLLTSSISGSQQKLTLWDLRSLRPSPVEISCGGNLNIFQMALDRDGSHAIIGESPSIDSLMHVRICETSTGVSERMLTTFQTINGVAFTPENEPAVYGSKNEPRIGALAGMDPLPAVYFPASGRKILIKPLSNPDNTQFVGFGDDGSVILLVRNFESRGEDCIYLHTADGDIRRLAGYRGAVTSAAYVGGQAHVVTVSGRTARIADLRRAPNLAAIRAHARPLNVLTLSPDEQTILTVDDNGKARFWDVQTGRLKRTISLTDSFLSENETGYLRPKVAQFEANGKRLITGNEKGEIQIWEVDTGRPICSTPGGKWDPEEYLFGVSFLAGGEHVVAAYTRGSQDTIFLNFMDASTCKQVGTFKFNERVSNLSFSRDGATILTSAFENGFAPHKPELKIWSLLGLDLRSGAPVQLSSSTIGKLPGPLRDVMVDGRQLRFMAVDESGELLMVGGGSSVRLEGSRGNLRFNYNVALSDNGKRAAMVTLGEARVWDTYSGKLLLAFKCDPDVNSRIPVILSADGTKLLIVGKDRTIRIYPTSREDFFKAARGLLGQTTKSDLTPGGSK